jgi:2-(1,2-epoxy-1,2-dihydrophenyl)acetyl-CoA isomerase
MSSDYSSITFDFRDGLAVMRFNRPSVLNSLSFSMLDEIGDALDLVARREDTRALLMTGNGRAFSAGADLSAAGPSTDPRKPRDVGAVVERYYNPIIERLSKLPVPIVVAVNGPAVGAGCSIALQGDIVIAARSAYFLQAFVRIGLVPDAGATWVLPRLIGLARAKAAMLLGERITAEQAAHWGLIYKVVDDAALEATAEQIASQLAKGPTIGLGLIRQAIQIGLDGTLQQSLGWERDAQRQAGFSADYDEGVRAFKEKREPQFTGR